MAYVDTTPIFANTTMQVSTSTYKIKPIDGYVLHDSRKDFPSSEDETVMIEGFTRYGVTVPLSYDFNANPYNIYAILESEVPDPENQIFGGGSNNETVTE